MYQKQSGRQKKGSHRCPCEYVTLHSKREIAGVIKLRTLRWENYPDGPDGLDVSLGESRRQETEGKSWEVGARSERCDPLP